MHGIPGPRVLAEGDLVSIDCGAIVDGWHGDAAITVALGDVRPEVAALVEVTEEALWAGIGAASLGGRVKTSPPPSSTRVRAAGDYGILEDYTGHGIGTAMHQPPDVPNVAMRGRTAAPGRGPGAGRRADDHPRHPRTRLLDDDWTVVTADGSLAAHVEHTFTLTERGAWVLTALDGGEAELTRRGDPTAVADRCPALGRG